VIGIVGPPGVGKTTTAAKIAARAIADDKTVTLVSCDTYRVGAVDQLKRYAKLLACKLMVVKTAEAMHKAIRSADTDIVIVDTAGRGPTDEQSPEAALGQERLLRDAPTGWEQLKRHVLLCIEASLRSVDAEQICRRYAVCGPTALAITKLDLTGAPGGLIHGAVSSELPVSTLCMGQRVPEDIAPATRGRILDYIAPRGATRLAS
jgi:flagellar biosynthesis protein FlhF